MVDENTFQHLVLSEEHSDREVAEIKATMPYPIIGAYSSIPAELWEKTNEELEKIADLGYTDFKVKTSFWKAYKLCAKNGSRMTVNKIINGVTNLSTFNKRFLGNSARLAWLLSPTTPYSVQVESLLDQSMKRYQELINMDITTTKKIKYKDESGNEVEKLISQVDPKKAMVLLSVIKNLEERAIGGTIQRQLSVKTQEPSTKDGERAEIDMEAVDKKLKELEEKLGGPSIDIEV